LSKANVRTDVVKTGDQKGSRLATFKPTNFRPLQKFKFETIFKQLRKAKHGIENNESQMKELIFFVSIHDC
jgi:hypothetical protein